MNTLQACRGKEVDAGVQVLHMADEVDGVKTMEPYVVCPSPLFKDFMIVYSTPPGLFLYYLTVVRTH